MKRQLTYYWWVYLLYGIFAITIIVTIYHAVDSPNENEQIRIAIAGDNIDTINWEEALYEYLILNSDQTIKKISVDYIDLENFEDAIVTRTLDGYDLFILPSSEIRANTGSFYFVPLTELQIDFQWELEILYMENDTAYGLRLNTAGADNHFSSYLDANETESYVLFINVFSVNIGDYNDYSNPNDYAAIETIEWLLSGDGNE